jgi:L-ribulose-5-phosphate 4-epimerase
VIDEGYTKFVVDWTQSAALDYPEIDELNRWRSPLYDAGLIGHYQQFGIGYGNISHRVDKNQFVISSTQTGQLAELQRRHYALVTAVDVTANRVACSGPLQASSESMTHAMLYSLDVKITAVVHVHSSELWTRLKDNIPTTAADVGYGTPAMAQEFARLYRDTGFADDGIAVMAGHEDGLITIGESMAEAATRVLELLD